MFNTHIDKSRANWMQTNLRMNLVEDQTDYVNYGAEVERQFYSFEPAELGLSYSDDFPAHYKIAGFTIFRDFDLYITSRSTYGLFHYFGDLGGLNEVLILFGTLITSYWTKAAAYRYAWHSLYYRRDKKNSLAY